ncbi:hypothetical protein BJ508DRAFT_416896 [Ascobolus immersus RN42]|uniref:NlpC/P60 domain-containing protein n=1 Tax=Ascobolus immersus RN42 TaxID=1160509 RepID=A0A3N4HX21_ASCIM|nr:hypothetical protein BJ508DRAFT_416896 [Ascobolus immersus RN42]
MSTVVEDARVHRRVSCYYHPIPSSISLTYLPGGFDCSGLTQYAVCKSTGNKKVIGRTTKLQYFGKGGKKLARKNAKPGDLVFWGKNCDKCSGGTCPGVYHVAIWLGKNKVFHASKPGVPVGEGNFWKAEVCSKVVRYW